MSTMKKTLILAIVAAVMFMFGPVLSAQACIEDCIGNCPGNGTIWMPTESGQVDVQYLSQSDADFAIFDDMADLAADPYFLINNYPGLGTADTVQFVAQPNGDWGLKHEQDAAPSFFLQGSNKFLLAMDNGSGWVVGNDMMELSYGMHAICFPDTCIEMVQIDAQPVPIPGAIYLLGAGLLGIAGFRKRK